MLFEREPWTSRQEGARQPSTTWGKQESKMGKAADLVEHDLKKPPALQALVLALSQSKLQPGIRPGGNVKESGKPRRDVGSRRRSDMVRLIDGPEAEQTRIDLVLRMQLAGLRMLTLNHQLLSKKQFYPSTRI